jgi:hypothetical protein
MVTLRDLSHPALIRMWCYTSELDLATGEMDEKQHIVINGVSLLT